MLLTRDEILEADDLELQEVQVPKWGGSVFLRAMSLEDRLAFENAFEANKGTKAVPLLLASTLCDGKGAPLFTVEDVERISKKNFAVLYKLFKAASKLNVLTEADVKELEGNSVASPPVASFSALPRT